MRGTPDPPQQSTRERPRKEWPFHSLPPNAHSGAMPMAMIGKKIAGYDIKE
jgi:hypothetical protein